MTQLRLKDEPISRRSFVAGLSAGSLALACKFTGAQQIAKVDSPEKDSLPFDPDLFLSIAPDGEVTIIAHRSEMGTGIKTSLPLVVADELGADWDRVVVQQAPADKRLGSQNTDGSRSVRRFFDRMRDAGATARMMLEQAAAATWGVSSSECKAIDHTVTHLNSDKEIGFGELVETARSLPVPEKSSLKYRPSSEWRYIGKSKPIVDQQDIVSGKAIFGIDVRRPNQVYAVVARPPVYGGQVRKFEATAALEQSGVIDVVEIPRFEGPHAFQPLGGVAVIAKSTWAAVQGRDSLEIEWEDGEHADYDSEQFRNELMESSKAKGKVLRSTGDVEQVFESASADTIHEADYYVPHLAHAPMEPPCAVCDVKLNDEGKVVSCEAWAPTQNPQGAQTELAKALKIEPEQVTIHVTLLGSGFGRKSKPDFITEAALLSKAVGRPVQVIWTREDDLQHGYYHTVAAVHMKAALDAQGKPTAWLQRSSFPSILTNWDPTVSHGAEFEVGQGLVDVPYEVENFQVENGAATAHTRIGWMRSVAYIYHAMALCSFPDELAHKAGRDPYEYLLELLCPDRHFSMEGIEYGNMGEPLEKFPIDVGRLRHVTKRVAELADWGKQLPRGSGQGIACFRSFLSYCAHVVEVKVSKSGEVSIPRVHVVIDAGTVVHPDRVTAQLEGAAIFATGLARYGEITFEQGRPQQSNYDDFEVARISDSPREIITEIVQSDQPPAGVGEVGVPTFSPALCNAIFAATGKRIRSLPLSRHDLSWS